MRALLDPDGPSPTTAAGLHERYRPPESAWVRANFVSSADGASSTDGTSGGLGNDADKRVFAALRDHADVVLVGAGTVRAEGYGPIDPSPERRARRVGDGRAEVPRLAVVGRPSKLAGDEAWIASATAEPLLITSSADPGVVPGCRTLVCGEDHVDIPAAIDRLAELGLTSVLCEGGPSLFAELAGSGRLQELCLSYSPLLAGPGPGRIVAGDPWGSARPARLIGLLEHESMLLCRYQLG